MKGMTIRLPREYEPKLKALAERQGLKPAEFARQKLIDAIEHAERVQHHEAMKEMVRQAIANHEIRDEALEAANLEAVAEQPT